MFVFILIVPHTIALTSSQKIFAKSKQDIVVAVVNKHMPQGGLS
jgi:hypothetical protein